ncbi:type II toxin-antitoxin system mRNA interferase toxin, RelE/StbE family [Candidatus Woesearchaeota archaeon]|nr:type II toxin-antitoxin system mRNA interferase toxin, RelE/StbE family [Candidatus Woesearchaeota archaeon]
MYEFTTRSKKAEKQFYEVFNSREGIREKLKMLMINPRKELNSHKLKGKLEGKWSCYLGWDIRLVYEIDDKNKEIVVVAAGSHKEVYG